MSFNAIRAFPSRPAATLAVALTALLPALPAAAQVPTVSIGFSSSGISSGVALEEFSKGCAFNRGQGIHLRASSGGATVTVNLMAHHLSGPTRLR